MLKSAAEDDQNPVGLVAESVQQAQTVKARLDKPPALPDLSGPAMVPKSMRR
jgi:hypothetical protein